MSSPCIGPCGRDCNLNQGHGRCAHCPGRPFQLPPQLRPLTNTELAIGLVLCMAILAYLGG